MSCNSPTAGAAAASFRKSPHPDACASLRDQTTSCVHLRIRKLVAQCLESLAHQVDLLFAPVGALQQAGDVLADDEFPAKARHVAQDAVEGLPCLATTIGDALAICAPLCVFGGHGLAHETDHEDIHKRDVVNLASYDVQSPPGLQLGDVWKDQGHLLLTKCCCNQVCLASSHSQLKHVLEGPPAGAAEVQQNLPNGIRATACRPHPPHRARAQGQSATLLRGEAVPIELHAVCQRGDNRQFNRGHHGCEGTSCLVQKRLLQATCATVSTRYANNMTGCCACRQTGMNVCTTICMDAMQHVWMQELC